MIITVSNYVAEVGKSFIATELANRLASSGYETLLMDFGISHRSCANLLDVKPIDKQDVYEFLTTSSELKDLVLDTNSNQLSLLAGSERTLKIFPSRYGGFSSANPIIQQFKKVRDYECVIIDTMPNDPILSFIYRMSDFVLIPINGYESSIKASKRVLSDLQQYGNMRWVGDYGVLLNNMDFDFQIDYEKVNSLPIMPMEISTVELQKDWRGKLYVPHFAEFMKSNEFDEVLEWIFLEQGEFYYAN